jgi:hypothetical protein
MKGLALVSLLFIAACSKDNSQTPNLPSGRYLIYANDPPMYVDSGGTPVGQLIVKGSKATELDYGGSSGTASFSIKPVDAKYGFAIEFFDKAIRGIPAVLISSWRFDRFSYATNTDDHSHLVIYLWGRFVPDSSVTRLNLMKQ